MRHPLTRRAKILTGRPGFGRGWERNEDERKICKALGEVAKQTGAKSIQAVAIAYVMQKTTHVFPIVGGRKAEQLESNIGALDVALSDEQIKFLEDVLTFDKGFPDSYIVSDIDGLCGLFRS